MDFWRWMVWALIALGVVAALFGLDQLCLWLEDRGWLYYRRKKPTSSPASFLVELQQFIEPGIKHVIQIKQGQRSEKDRTADKDRLFANLLATLDSPPVNVEVVRLYLGAAKNAGLDWRGLYEEVVRATLLARPDRVALIPPIEDVTPIE